MRSKLSLLKYFLPVFLLGVLGAFLWMGIGKDTKKVPSPLIGKAFPDFNLPSLENPMLRVTEKDIKGHVALINVWATWCITCHSEHPYLMDIAENTHVPIYGVDYKDNRASAKAWLKKYGNPYKKVIFDEKGLFAIDLGVYGTPETYLVDSKGIIRYKYIGAINHKVWSNEIYPIIKRLKQG